MLRRDFLVGTGLTAAGAVLLGGCEAERDPNSAQRVAAPAGGWGDVRRQFQLDPDLIHMTALLLAANPAPVREAISRHRRELDQNPAGYVVSENNQRKARSREAAAAYLGGSADHVALTDSTTMGIAMVYHGLRLQPGDEILTTRHDYYATHESLRQVAERTGATIQSVSLFDEPEEVSVDLIVSRLVQAVTPRTRAVALTWVHSSTGVKLPIRDIASALADLDRGRDEADRVLVCVDGVHGFGIENMSPDDLGCDFFMAGCHKWLFGPRGTGVVWARPADWARLRPFIPSFVDDASWSAWSRGEAPSGPTTAARMTPGGFKPFEHQWAMAEAFEFHMEVGKARIEERTHALARRIKEGLAEMGHVRLITPMASELSSGIVCFDVDGLSPDGVVRRLRDRSIIASTTPYAVSHARLTPCIYNSEEEVDIVLDVLRNVA